MTTYVALLRAVNVGGTGKLPMAELKAMAEACGFDDVTTYIASGNVVFRSRNDEAAVQKALAAALQAYAGKPVGVLVRTAAEMADVLAANPFPEAAPNRTMAIFLDAAPPKDAITAAKNVRDEELRLGKREIYVHYGDGIGESKLKIPAADAGTARNMNTVAKLASMAAEINRRIEDHANATGGCGGRCSQSPKSALIDYSTSCWRILEAGHSCDAQLFRVEPEEFCV